LGAALPRYEICGWPSLLEIGKEAMRCALFVGLAAFLITFGVAPAGEGGKTPEEAFKAMQEAHRKGGTKASVPYMTRDSQKAEAGGMLIKVYSYRNYLNSLKEKPEDKIKEIDALLKKHDVDVKKLKEREKDKPPPTPDAVIALLVEVGGMPKEPASFSHEADETYHRLSGMVAPFELVPDDAVVKDLKVTGDAAKGTMHYTTGEKELSDPVFFRREGTLWRIDFLPTIRTSLKK
jgi:hypothetical protein